MYSDITLVIPTYNNRHLYLTRILDYYKEVAARFQILVIDTSPTPFKEAPNYPAMHYMHHPGEPYTAKLSRAMKMVRTPYVVLCADDDFITLDGIETCTEFLRTHADYASAQGHLVAFEVPGKVKPIPWMFQITGLDFNDATATARILHFFKYHLYLHYSVHRTENLVDTFTLSENFTDSFALGTTEYLLDIISLVNGKHKVLPVFYSAQELAEISARNTVTSLVALRGMADYKEEFRVFTEKISMHLAKKENLDESAAQHFVVDFFNNHPFFQTKPLLSPALSNPLSNPRFRYMKLMVDKMRGVHYVKRYYSSSVYFLRAKMQAARKKQLLKSQTRQTRNTGGFPFYDADARREWEIIKRVIENHARIYETKTN